METGDADSEPVQPIGDVDGIGETDEMVRYVGEVEGHDDANPNPDGDVGSRPFSRRNSAATDRVPPTSKGDGSDSDDSDNDDDDVQAPKMEGAYNPAEFENLPVSGEVKSLFQYILRYTPQTIELDHRLKPFIPDYIPAVGDIDAFIKVPKPSGGVKSSEVKANTIADGGTLGLTCLDEPAAKQSDPTVLDLTLRAVVKQTSAKAVSVKTIDEAEKNTKAVEKWIKDISDLHRSKPPPTVHYSKPMPDIDSLMQEWPADFEDCLKEVGIPSAELDCTLQEYVDLTCGLLDIPVYKSRIQSLHVLFTLYSAFKQSQHFQAFNKGPSQAARVEADRLVIE